MKLSSSLVFYIGNGVVKGAIVANEKGKQPTILSTRVRELPHFNERDREHLEKRILFEFGELVREVKSDDFTKIIKTHSIKIDNACVLMSSPWYISETSVIKMDEVKPFTVTDSLLATSKENLVKAYRDAHEVDVAVLEQKIIHILLNGYPTNEPLRKKASTLDMTIFTSFARKSSIEQIRDTIDQNFHIKKSAIHSQSLVSFTVISDAWSNILQYVIADVTSQLTELVSVRKGALSEAFSFPKGKQYIVSAISDSLKVSTEVAESLIRMKNEGKIDSDLGKKVDIVIQTVKKDWLKSFSDSLSVMSSSSSLPSTFFLFAPKDVLNIFSDFISSEEYQQFSFAEGKFTVKNIGIQDLQPFCKVEQGADSDLSLMIGSVFNNKMNSL